MRLFLKTLKIAFLSVAVVVTIVALVLTAFWLKPSVFVNTKTVAWALHTFAPQSTEIRWKELRVEANSVAFWQKRIHLSASELCVDEQKTLHVCMESALLKLDLAFKGFLPRARIELLQISNGRADLSPAPSAEATPVAAQAATLWPTPPSFLSFVEIGTVNIDFSQVVYRDGKSAVAGQARLDGKGAADRSAWNLSLKGGPHGKEPQTARSVGAVLHAKSTGTVWFGPYDFKAEANAVLAKGETASLRFHGNPKDAQSLVYALSAKYREGKKVVEGTLRGTASAKSVSAQLDVEAKRFLPLLPSMRIHTCKVAYEQAASSAQSHLKVHCPLCFGTKIGQRPRDDLFRTFDLVLTSDLRVHPGAKNKAEIDGSIQVQADPLLSSIREGRGAFSTKIAGSLDQFPKELSFDTSVDLEIKDFQRLAKAVQRHPWAVPEPFNSLAGELKLHAEGKGKLPYPGGSFPLQLTTKLASDRQKLDLDAQGTLLLKQGASGLQTHFSADVVLSDVCLVLPPLSKQAPPQMFPDARISKYLKKKTPGAASSFSYAVNIYTPDAKPVRLLSNLAKDEIPLRLELRVTSESGVQGKVHISTFPVELFRRVASIQRLNITLKPKAEESLINGEIRVRYTDYTIRILILGLLGKPQVRFVSDPPLSEDQALAVLLFGKKLDALDRNQASSVGSAEAAVADGAITLASMYLLASTPVESIGYNPMSRVVTAKIRLADGTSLNVGSDMSQLNEVGIRRQLGSHWAIASYLQHPLDPVQRSVAAFLEWSAGY